MDTKRYRIFPMMFVIGNSGREIFLTNRKRKISHSNMKIEKY